MSPGLGVDETGYFSAGTCTAPADIDNVALLGPKDSSMKSTSAMARAKNLVARRPVAVDLLRGRDFRNFWLANAASDLGIALRLVAVGWLVLELTDSALWVASPASRR